ncbi:MAG: carbohydrate ABC transporter permease [Haloechinothrix sp.]
MAAAVVYPMVWSLWYSFHAWYPAQGIPPRFVGLENYEWLFTSGRFWNSVTNLLILAGVGVAVQMALATAIALALYEAVKSSRWRIVLLSLFLLPMTLAPIVVGDIWRLIFTQEGVLNYVVGLVGLPAQSWVGSDLGIWSVVLTDVWQWTALPLLIIFSGRATIPHNLYEAARLDGASWWYQTRRITLPLLRDLIAIALILRLMDAYKLIDTVFVVTSQGAPGSANEVPGLLGYLLAFQNFDMGRAAALTWMLGLGAILAIQVLWTVMRRRA